MTEALPMTGGPLREELLVAKAACENARWPEQHRDDCLWCRHITRQQSAVAKVNTILGVNLWEVPSFRADVRIDFDEYGRVLSATLLNKVAGR